MQYYPNVSQDVGDEAAVQSVLLPRWNSSHVAPETPAPSMKVGSWVMQFHAYRAAFDNPVSCLLRSG